MTNEDRTAGQERHTPGPWRLSESKGGQFYVYGDDSSTPFRPFVKIPKRHTKLMRANAQLISAAPELLEACRLAEIWLCNCMPIGDVRGPKPLPIIRAAIAKATAPPQKCHGVYGQPK